MNTSPFNYTDYRKFLHDFFKESKKRYTFVCKETGIKSTGHLSLILHGKVDINQEQTGKFARLCNLKKRATRFFSTMVQFNQETKAERKLQLFDELTSFRESAIYRVGPHLYRYYDKWYYSVIRALLEFVDIKDNIDDLAKMVVPSIRPDQARRSIRVLSTLALIEKDADGCFRPTSKSIDSGSSATSLMINNFVLSMLGLAREAMDRFPRDERMFSCVTLGIDKNGFEELVIELREFRRRAAEIAQRHSADRVVQVNFQLFPVSKNIARKAENEIK